MDKRYELEKRRRNKNQRFYSYHNVTASRYSAQILSVLKSFEGKGGGRCPPLYKKKGLTNII